MQNSIHERMHDVIKNSGLSYRELSMITKIPHSTLQRWAMSKQFGSVPIWAIKVIADATNINPDYLAGWTDEKVVNMNTNIEKPGFALGIAKAAMQNVRDSANQTDLYNRANEKCMTALEAMEAAAKKLQASIVENDLSFDQLGELTDHLSKLSCSMATVRMSMGLNPSPFAMGLNSGQSMPNNTIDC